MTRRGVTEPIPESFLERPATDRGARSKRVGA